MDVDLADGVTTVRIDHPPVNAFDLGLVDDALATVQSIDGPIVLTCGASTAAWTCEAKPLDRIYSQPNLISAACATRCRTGVSVEPGPAGRRGCSTGPKRPGPARVSASGRTWSGSPCPARPRTGRAQLFCPLDLGYGRRMDVAPPLLAVPDHTELTCNG